MTIPQNFYGFPIGSYPISSLNLYFPPSTSFVVGPTGNYSTIQAGINAANKSGGGIVLVQPGDYSENLTLYDACHVTALTLADTGGGVNITGVHTPPSSGGFVFNNVRLISSTNIFYSTASGSAHLLITNAEIFVTNGYTFNLQNWTGKLESFDVNAAVGTNDGYVNNSGGSEIDIFSSSVGSGTSNSMVVSGPMYASGTDIFCPITFSTGAVVEFDYSYFAHTVTLSGNSTGELASCTLTTGATAAVAMGSSGSWILTNCTINSSNSPCISGAGAGVLKLNGISYLSGSSLSGTLTLSTSCAFSGGELRANSDIGGSTGFTSLTSSKSTTISTGAGSVKMSSSNAANNSGWIKIYIDTTQYWLPVWSTNSP